MFVLVIERQSRIFVADTVWPIVQLVALVFGLLVGAVTMWRYFFSKRGWIWNPKEIPGKGGTVYIYWKPAWADALAEKLG